MYMYIAYIILHVFIDFIFLGAVECNHWHNAKDANDFGGAHPDRTRLSKYFLN